MRIVHRSGTRDNLRRTRVKEAQVEGEALKLVLGKLWLIIVDDMVVRRFGGALKAPVRHHVPIIRISHSNVAIDDGTWRHVLKVVAASAASAASTTATTAKAATLAFAATLTLDDILRRQPILRDGEAAARPHLRDDEGQLRVRTDRLEGAVQLALLGIKRIKLVVCDAIAVHDHARRHRVRRVMLAVLVEHGYDDSS